MGYRYIVRQQSIDYPNRFERDLLLGDYVLESVARGQVMKLFNSFKDKGFEEYPALGPNGLRKIENDGVHETYIVFKIEPVPDSPKLG